LLIYLDSAVHARTEPRDSTLSKEANYERSCQRRPRRQ